MTTDEGAVDEIDWRWVADARLAAMRMQALSDEARSEAVTVARTVMLALTAYRTPIGRSPLLQARHLAQDLAASYSDVEASALHCASLLFFFDWIEAKEYHNIGLPQEFWRFGEVALNGIGFDPRPMFVTDSGQDEMKDADAWLFARAGRVRRALELIAGDRPAG